MHFEWDEQKNQINIRKHGFDFADAPAVFAGVTFTFEDDRFDYEEQRFITLGMLAGKVVVIAHTERDDRVRIISMRKATKYEQKLYFQGFTN
ncbi:MAG: BrnT family toxin [Anaerolineales bacterium]|nr:MAG: BrnT family toxin [Anaerolineales bacterium]